MSRRDGPLFFGFALPPAGITVTTLRKQFAAFWATGVKVGVKASVQPGRSGLDLACSDQRVAVVLAAGVDRCRQITHLASVDS